MILQTACGIAATAAIKINISSASIHFSKRSRVKVLSAALKIVMLKRIQVMTTRRWPLSFDIDEEVGPYVDNHEDF